MRHLADGERDDARPLVALGERGENRLADPAFGEVVLDRDDRAGHRAERLLVDRLDRVQVDHARLDAVLRKCVRGLERFRHRHARGDDRDVIAVSNRARAADLELLVRPVDHGHVRPQRADVRDPLDVGHLCDELRGLVRVARMQHGRAVDGAECSDVLERHL